MTILTVKVPEGKASDVSKYIKNMGGEVVSSKQLAKGKDDKEIEADEVTHESYFGENIKRVINAFKS